MSELNMLWPQRCKICGKRDKIDFQVSDEIWAAVVPPPYQNNVVCLGCFDAIASQKGIDYSDAINKEIYFAGDGASFVLRIVARAEAPKC